MNPRIGILKQAVQRIRDHAFVDDHADAGAGLKQGIQIVRDHDDGEPQLRMQVQQ